MGRRRQRRRETTARRLPGIAVRSTIKHLLLLGLAAIVILFTVLWVVSLRLEDSSIADIAWGPGILVLALIYYFTSNGAPLRAQSDAGAAGDLGDPPGGAHLFSATRLQGEDFRYEMLRAWRSPTTWWWFSYFRVFLLQAVVGVGRVAADLFRDRLGRAPRR